MPETKKPQDHQPKKKNVPTPHPEEAFTFTHRGQEYTLAAPLDVLDAGWARVNRNKTLDDQFFSLIEALADPEALAAIDSMKKQEFIDFQLEFYAHAGVELGESLASLHS